MAGAAAGTAAGAEAGAEVGAETGAKAGAAAATEGLTLVRDYNASGFRKKIIRGNRYQATIRHTGESHYIGSFRTPEAAALPVAR